MTLSRSNFWKPVQRHVVDPVDGLPLRVFEAMLVCGFLVRFTSRLVHWREWLTPRGFHLTAKQAWDLGYPQAWPLLEQPWMVAALALGVYAGALAAVTLRWRRLGLIALFFAAVYTEGVDYLSASSQERIYVAVFALLATAPGVWRDAGTGRLMVAAAPVRVMQATLVLIYFVAGYTKCHPGDWLKYPDVVWTQVQGFHRTEFAAWALRTLPKGVWAMMQYGTLIFEVGAPVWFTCRRTRPFAIAFGLSLHLMIAVMMKGLIFFALQMWSFYALFISPEIWRRVARAVAARYANRTKPHANAGFSS